MAILRISAAPFGRLSDRTAPWTIFGERPGVLDGLEDSALAGAELAQIDRSLDAEMFDPSAPFGAHLAAQSIATEPLAPVVVFVHGFGYEPRRPVAARCRSDNAHRSIYHFEETAGGPGSAEERRRHLTPWFARAMLPNGTGTMEDCEGLAVGYAYSALGESHRPLSPDRWTRRQLHAGFTQPWRQPAQSYRQVYDDAGIAGLGLAALLSQLRQRLEADGLHRKPINIFCHGLGARTVMAALEMLGRRSEQDETLERIGRVVMVNGFCYWGQVASAMTAMTSADIGGGPLFYNIVSRTDDVLHYLASRVTIRAAAQEALAQVDLTRSLIMDGRTIGCHGIPPAELHCFKGAPWHGWIDLPLESRRLRRWGAQRDMAIRGGRLGRGNHWLALSEPGNWALVRAILHRAPGTDLASFRAELSKSRHPRRRWKSAKAA